MNPRRTLRMTLLVPFLLSGLACAPAVAPRPAPRGVVALGRLDPAGGVLNVGAEVGDRVEKLDDDYERVYSPGEPLGRMASWADRNVEVALAQTQLDDARKRRD